MRTVIPDSMFVKLKYYDQQSISTSGTDPYQVAIRANSIFDPEFAPGGDTVVGYPEWANFYGEYCVKASKITVVLNNLASADDGVLAVFPNTLTPFSETMDAPLLEPQSQPRVKAKTIYSRQAPPRNIGKLSYYMTTAKAFQRPLAALGPSVNASMGVNPTAEWFWNIQWNYTDNPVGHPPASMEIYVKYWVQLLRPDTQYGDTAS